MSSDTIFGFPKYPPFQLNSPRFHKETSTEAVDEYLHYLDVVDPSTLFTSDKRLRESVQLLEDYQKGVAKATDQELWRAQKVKQAILHPDTGEKVLPPFRMSGFVPFGWITVTGMLLPNPSWPTLLFWQWMNQSHNACVNYANRNATQVTIRTKVVLKGKKTRIFPKSCSLAKDVTITDRPYANGIPREHAVSDPLG
ncbi:tricarboxylate carrier [Cooperia oncophora]